MVPDRIYLLGHSMGGKAAPRITAADPSIVGLVMLAADTQLMHETAVRVARYLADLAPAPGADEAVSTMVRQAASVSDPFLTPDTPSELLTLGISAAYWLDLRAYDPVAPGRPTDSPDADPSREEGLPSDRRR
ncbi:alpha/beta hydrolase [Streptomyces sp. NRRL WC-3744]|uniref:alpha/beta hydrolase n=1 Tax=Streptomyces sp. NRRL WC-3744 TaxID=1463935 RepID=UPI00068A8790|nr:alpha/beta hydrolase [Streptomyces sp. NRRL WC-3744]